MPKIDQAAIASMVIPLPALDQQGRITERVELVTDAVESQRNHLTGIQKRASTLRRSLLAAAFSGRLTSTTDVEDLVSP